MHSLDYKIPKIEVKAVILLDEPEAKPAEYILFFNEFSRYRRGQETMFEFLNAERSFIPVKDAATGEFMVFNIDQILFLREIQNFEAPPGRKPVVVHLSHKIQLKVEHFKLLPDSQSRILDYLNEQSRFIVFFYNGHRMFINKHKIVKVKGY